MAVEFYLADDTTLVSELAFTGVEAGQDSATLTVHLWNSKGIPGGQAVQNVILIQQTEDPTEAGVYRSSDLPPQDEMWGRGRIVGYDNTGDPSWSVENSDWVPLGAYSGLPIGTIPPDCAVYLERRLHPPSTATSLQAWRILDSVLKDEYSRPLPVPLTLIERGILPLTGDRSTSVVLRGCAVTPTGTPDDEFHVAAGMWQSAGRAYGKITTDHALDQNDSAAAALASGQSYYVTISLSSAGVVATKGVKAVSPTKPAVPTGNAFLAWILVGYDAGGTVIETADITGTPAYGRYLVTDAGGLNVTVHRGQSIAGGSYRVHTGSQVVALTDAATNYLWEVSSGLLDVNTTGLAPDTGSILIAVVTTAGGAVTLIDDVRPYAGRSVVLTLKGATPAVAAYFDEVMFEHPAGDLEEVAFRVSDQVSLGSGSAGATTFEIKKNGTTIFTSSGTEDLRPSIAYNSAVLQSRTAIPEVTQTVRGDLWSATPSAVPTGQSPARCELALTFRIP